MHDGNRTHLEIYVRSNPFDIWFMWTGGAQPHIPVQFSQGPYCIACSRPPSVSSEPLSPLRWIHFVPVCPCHIHTAFTHTHTHTHTHRRTKGEKQVSHRKGTCALLLLHSAHYQKAIIDCSIYSASEQSISSCICNTRPVPMVSHEQPCEFVKIKRVFEGFQSICFLAVTQSDTNLLQVSRSSAFFAWIERTATFGKICHVIFGGIFTSQMTSAITKSDLCWKICSHSVALWGGTWGTAVLWVKYLICILLDNACYL